MKKKTTSMGFRAARKKMAARLYEEPYKKPTKKKKSNPKKATHKKAAKKVTKRRRTKKSPLMRKIDELNALAKKSLRSAESCALQSKTAKTQAMRKRFDRASRAFARIAERAQKKANDLLITKTK